MELGVVAFVFRCSATGNAVTATGDETTDVAWRTLNEIKQLMHEAYTVRLLNAFVPSSPAIRTLTTPCPPRKRHHNRRAAAAPSRHTGTH